MSKPVIDYSNMGAFTGERRNVMLIDDAVCKLKPWYKRKYMVNTAPPKIKYGSGFVCIDEYCKLVGPIRWWLLKLKRKLLKLKRKLLKLKRKLLKLKRKLLRCQ